MQIRDLIPWSRQDGELPGRDDENPIVGLQREVNRIFNSFWNRFDSPLGSTSIQHAITALRTDIVEHDKEVEVSIELLGMDEKDIDVSLTEDALTIKGEKKAQREDKKNGYYLNERSYGSFYRTIPLPPGIATDKTEAQFKKGVLTIILPRTPEAQARVRKVEVKAT